MKQNLGKVDRVLRFLLAFWWLGPFAPQYQPTGINWVIFIVGWVALIESFACWCLLHEWFKINNKNQ